MDAESAQYYLDKLCEEVEELLRAEPTKYTCIWWRGHTYGVTEVISATAENPDKLIFTGVEIAQEKLDKAEESARHLR